MFIVQFTIISNYIKFTIIFAHIIITFAFNYSKLLHLITLSKQDWHFFLSKKKTINSLLYRWNSWMFFWYSHLDADYASCIGDITFRAFHIFCRSVFYGRHFTIINTYKRHQRKCITFFGTEFLNSIILFVYSVSKPAISKI